MPFNIAIYDNSASDKEVQLISVNKGDESTQYIFGLSFREDFIHYSLILDLNKDTFQLEFVEINSFKFGVAKWGKNGNLISCTSWEDESDFEKLE